MNQARNMHTASNLYMESAGWPSSCHVAIKVTSAELASPINRASPWGHVIRSFNTVSCIVTQFERETFGICRFRGSCMREIDLI